MDSNIFQFVTLATAIGGIVGTGVGYHRLERERLRTLKHAHEDAVILADKPITQTLVSRTSDMMCCVGTLGMSSLYGMIVYPLVPPIILPYVVACDMKK